jgi:hypothetical protein
MRLSGTNIPNMNTQVGETCTRGYMFPNIKYVEYVIEILRIICKNLKLSVL